jgi:hypothetical protein
MLLDTPEFDHNLYIGTDLRYGRDLEEELSRKIEAWLDARTAGGLELSGQIFIVKGELGIGKSWFAHCAEHSAIHKLGWAALLLGRRRRMPIPETVYVDLRGRLGSRSSQAFVNQVRDRISQFSEDKPLCLCLDHVPPKPDLELQIVEDKLVWPHLTKHQGFLLLVQEDPRLWGFGGKIPHLPAHVLDPFKEAGIRNLVQALGDGQVDVDTIAWYSDGHPLLARWMCERGLREGIETFIDHALEAKGKTKQKTEILQQAYSLSLVKPKDKEMARTALGAYNRVGQVSEKKWQNALIQLKALKWIESYRSREERYEVAYEWIPRMQRCLRYMFREDEPIIYERVKQAVEEV